jgi:hypothetical protein
MYVHALHTVHVVPDLRVAAGRLRDGVSLGKANPSPYFNPLLPRCSPANLI